MIRPISVSVEVPYPIDKVYGYLDVIANHESFTDHLMTDWSFSGPARGVGSKAHATLKVGRSDTIDIEVVSADPPHTSVERNVSAGGKRVGNGTYRLEELPGEKTRITFEYSWQQAPAIERLAAPMVRRVMIRGNQTAMRRLSEQLDKTFG